LGRVKVRIVIDLKLTVVRAQPRCKEVDGGFCMIRLPKRALPNGCDAPPSFKKLSKDCFVPSDIRFELRPPEVLASRWGGGVATPFVTMPETAMHEDDGAILRENKVRSSVDFLAVEPESETVRVQRPPESHLGLGVLSPNSRHHPGTCLLIYDIGCVFHAMMGSHSTG
jgi:hypothetical protein